MNEGLAQPHQPPALNADRSERAYITGVRSRVDYHSHNNRCAKDGFPCVADERRDSDKAVSSGPRRADQRVRILTPMPAQMARWNRELLGF